MVLAKILVIEAADSPVRILDTLLHFLEIEPVHVPDVAELRRRVAEAPDEWLAVVAGDETIAAHVGDLAATLRCHAPTLPIIYVTAEGLPKASETFRDLTWLPLELPLKQRRVTAVLAQAKSARRGGVPVPAVPRFRPSGVSAPMRGVHRLIEQVAPFDTNVLILGESGTGKEMVARHIHELSARAGQPFVPVNCGAIPAELLESELFGHEKGAFTGALSTRLGRFEFAEGGTLFLDEIGDMSVQMQVKLLRVLQERSFERVGSNRTITCNVRIIAATHRNLEAAIEDGAFREDLFYRLNVFPLQMPPLRDRLEDLPVLIETLIQRQDLATGRPIQFDQQALNCLARNPWPGNVRELSNLLERLAILYPGQVIGAADLPERYRGQETAAAWFGAGMRFVMPREETSPVAAESAAAADREPASHDLPRGGLDLKDHLNAIELGLIRKALQEADGTVAEAARLLRMRRTTPVEKLRKYRLSA